MDAKWILLFVLMLASTGGFSQFHQKANSQVQWNSLSFFTGTNYLRGASGSCGIYSSASDRQQGKLSIAIDCRAEDHKIKLGFVRARSAIKIIREDEIQSFLQSDIHGYRDCNGNEYHFFDRKSYELVNPGEKIPIYRTYSQKGKQRTANYFFATRNGQLSSLKLANLRREFSDHPLFLEKLDVLAKNDFQLVKYLRAINLLYTDASRSLVTGH